MKILYQILIILFVLVSLFIVRNDLVVLYHKTADLVYQKMNYNQKQSTDVVIAVPEETSKFTTYINTPGALRVISDLVSNANLVRISAKEIITATNKNRIQNGNLSALIENQKLVAAAQAKLDDLFAGQYFEQVSPSGVDIKTFADRAGYSYIMIGGNLALGNVKDSDSLLRAWMASPAHRANILNEKYTEVGVAVGHRMFEGKDTWIAVEYFGLPRTVCPETNEVLHGTILLMEKDITTMEHDLITRHDKINKGAIYEGKTTEEQVSEYNSLVKVYTNKVAVLQQKITEYNKGVRTMKNCIEAITKDSH